MKYIIKTEGMGCAHCIKRVTEAMNSLNARIERVELNDIAVEFCGSSDEIRNSIEDLGFEVLEIITR